MLSWPDRSFTMLDSPHHPTTPRRLGILRQAWLIALLCLALAAMPLAAAFAQAGQSAATPPPQPPKDWWSAIRRDDVSTVQNMLLRGVDPTVWNELGNPALTQAAREQSWRVFDLLAKAAKVQVDQPNALNETPLMYLAILGEGERARNLIRAGAQVNRLGWTPLHYAASKAQMDMAAFLIEQGAIVNAPGPDGTTPLMMAALSGNRDMAGFLLQQGADPTMVNAARETAIDWAKKRNHKRMASWLTAETQAFSLRRQAQAAGRSDPAAATPPPTADNRTGSARRSDDPASFSRYFDLDRFENETEPAR